MEGSELKGRDFQDGSEGEGRQKEQCKHKYSGLKEYDVFPQSGEGTHQECWEVGLNREKLIRRERDIDPS